MHFFFFVGVGGGDGEEELWINNDIDSLILSECHFPPDTSLTNTEF